MRVHAIFIAEIVCTISEKFPEGDFVSPEEFKDFFENGDFAHNLELRAASDGVKVHVYQKSAQCAFEDENND